MLKRIILCAACCCLLLLGFYGQTIADRSANGSLQWHSIRQYAELRDSVDRKIYIHFWAEWCGYCRKMENVTFANPAVAALLQENFFLIKVNTDKQPRVADAFRVGGLPANLFLTQYGEQIDRRDGYIPPGPFRRVLKGVLRAD